MRAPPAHPNRLISTRSLAVPCHVVPEPMPVPCHAAILYRVTCMLHVCPCVLLWCTCPFPWSPRRSSGGTTVVKYLIPTRGLLGLRNALLTASRGTAVINTVFDRYGEWAGDMSTREQGSLVSRARSEAP